MLKDKISNIESVVKSNLTTEISSAMTNDSSRCDTSGSGLIDNEDFRDLCAGFGIEEV